ncbi:hypothetical protein niasHS_006986 [Heterodera schachtii]|uniref:polynucleotide adenylyltransferase n=1 Tax=Heterodera schachtii TaxID=97005 RepID=A0ABD2JF68_HETSC
MVRMEFEQLRESTERKNLNKLDLVDVCRFWKLEKFLKNNIKKLSKNYNCNDLAAANRTLPNWAVEFNKDISQKHYTFISDKFASESGDIKANYSKWFSANKLADECELSYAFRMVSIGGNVEKINAIKTVFDQCLLINTHASMLYGLYTLHTSAYILNQKIFLILLTGMFSTELSKRSNSSEWLEYTFFVVKILAFVHQLKDEKSAKNKIEICWKVLYDSGEIMTANESIGVFKPILAEFEDQFSCTNKMPKNYQNLIQSYGKFLMEFLHLDEKFKNEFYGRKAERERLMNIFLIVDKEKAFLDKQFWSLFDVQPIKNNVEESRSSSSSEINLMKKYKECPNVKQPNFLENSQIANEDKEAHGLIKLYIDLMKNVENVQTNGQMNKLVQNLEMNAAVWVSKEQINELLKFAESINDKSEEFVEKISQYKIEWDKMATTNGQNVDKDKLLFSFYKFVHTLIEDNELKINKKWNLHVKNLLKWSTNLFETKLVLLILPICAKNTCSLSDEKMEAEFKQKIKNSQNWKDQIHFHALTQLINKFDEFAHILCHGSGEISNNLMRERLGLIVPEKAFGAIEAFHPEIMDYPCDNEEEVKYAFEQQRIITGVTHLKILQRLFEPKPENEWFLAKILAIPGAKSRLLKMVNVQQEKQDGPGQEQHVQRISIQNVSLTSSTSSSELNVMNEIMKLWDKCFENKTDSFSNVKLLELYKNILFGGESNISLCQIGELSKADVIVFVQWMDDKIGTARHTISNKRMANLWKKQKRILDDVFDMVSDESELIHRVKRYSIGQWFLNIQKNYIEINKKMSDDRKFDLTVADRWDNIFSNLLNFDTMNINEEKEKEYKKWIGQLHKNAITKLSREENVFAEKLRKEYSSSKNVLFRRFLVDLVGESKIDEEIWKKNQVDKTDEIVIENKFNNLNLIENPSPKKAIKEKIVEKSKCKNKKPKKKNKNQENIKKNEDTPKKEHAIEYENEIEPEQISEIRNKANSNEENDQIFREKSAKNSQTKFAGIKLANFEDDNFLAKIFKQIFENFQNNPDNLVGLSSSAQLLHFGIYANELCNRIKLINQLKEALPEIGIDHTDNIENEWDQLKIVDLSSLRNSDKLIAALFRLLKQIVAKMDKFEVPNEQIVNSNEQNFVKHLLIRQKFAKFIVEHYEKHNWSYLRQSNKIGIMKTIFVDENIDDEFIEKYLLESVKMFIMNYEKLNSQIKLDKDIFEISRNDQFMEQTDDQKLWNLKAKLYFEISKGWQEIDYDEITSKTVKKFNQIKNVIEQNGYSDDDLTAKFKKTIELKSIFEQWSDDARFQMPVSQYLMPNIKKLETICILTEEFDISTKVFGIFLCDFAQIRRQCNDNSLYCKFCKDQRVKFLIKHYMDKLSPVPKLEFTFMGVHFVVHFVVLSLPSIPNLNFGAQQIRPILKQLENKLQKLIYETNLIEEYDPKKSADLKWKLEEELFLDDTDEDKVQRILEQLDRMNNEDATKKYHELNNVSNETKRMNQIKVESNRKTIEKMRANLDVLRRHAQEPKILEFLLPKEELRRLNHLLDETVINGSTMTKFRAAYAILELWAKRKHIFNKNIGHFNAQVICIMLTKVFLLFPGYVSVPFLVEKFFLIYSIWNWPSPVQLTNEKLQENNSDQKISMEMPIISPAFPEQNVSTLINPTDAREIKNEFKNAFKTIRALEEYDYVGNFLDNDF